MSPLPLLRFRLRLDTSYRKPNSGLVSFAQDSIENKPLLRTLQGRMGDKRGILILGEAVSEEPEAPSSLGMIKPLLLSILLRSSSFCLMTFANWNTCRAKYQRRSRNANRIGPGTVLSRFLHVQRRRAMKGTAEFCDDVQGAIGQIREDLLRGSNA